MVCTCPDPHSLQIRARAMFPSWAQLRTRRPHTTELRMFRPNVPKFCALLLGSTWAQVGANWPEFGASWAQVGSCSAQLKAKDSRVWPQSALVGPSRSASFLSGLFPACGRCSSGSNSNKTLPEGPCQKSLYNLLFQLRHSVILRKEPKGN